MFAWISSAVIIGLAGLVSRDARALGAKRGRLGGGLLDMGPVGWFVYCCLLWFVGFPCYLVAVPPRPRVAPAS